jgi:adenylylsulfate kinase
MLALMAGLPGSGKSTLARALAVPLQALVLDKDTLRQALFGGSSPALNAIEYSTSQDDFVVEIMLRAAGWLLERQPERIVILDGRPFGRAYQVKAVLDYAQNIGQPVRIIECTCSEQAARQRLLAGSHPAANRDFNLYLQLKAAWEELPPERLVVNTERSLDQCVQDCLDYLRP